MIFGSAHALGLESSGIDRLSLRLSLADVAKDRDDDFVLFARRCAIKRVAPHLNPDKLARPVSSQISLNTKFERTLFREFCYIGERCEKSRAIGDVDSVKEPVPGQIADGNAEQRLRCR